MTCIVGLAQAGRVWIGADSAGVSNFDLRVRADRKVFRNRDCIMGFTSSFRMGQLLAVKFEPPPFHIGDDVFRYMVDAFVEGVRSCLADGGFRKTELGVDSGGTFLVGFQGRLFCVEGDFQIRECAEGFDAVGCGESFALGSLAETAALAPQVRVEHALAAAERFSAGVRGPFFVEELAR